MDAPTRGATRLARAAAFGVSTLALASCAHVAGGGALPSMTILATLAVPVTMVAMTLTGRRCGPVLLLGSMTAAQILLHETLMVLTAQVPVDVVPANMTGQMSPGFTFVITGHTMAQPDGWSLTMTAVPAFIASLMTRPHGSRSEGRTRTSAAT
jgi:hypothetical protein